MRVPASCSSSLDNLEAFNWQIGREGEGEMKRDMLLNAWKLNLFLYTFIFKSSIADL